MRLSIHMVVAALSLWFALAAGARASLSRTKQPRATRGFKNTEMMTARGFGKRGLVLHGQESVNGISMGPSENFLDMLDGAPQEHGLLDQFEDKLPESVPIDWFVDELLNNPELTKTIVRKFMDTNQDGMISPDELLRNMY